MFSSLRYVRSHEWALLFGAFLLYIDTYYRTEWFYLHTSWGHALLAPFFGGE